MLKIRLHGTLDNILLAKKQIENCFAVLSSSKVYKDRGDSKLYRIYINVQSNIGNKIAFTNEGGQTK